MSDSGSDNSEAVKAKPHKIFVTGLDGASDLKVLEQELREIFSQYGELDAVVPKKSYNEAYSYAFIDFKEGEDATVAVEKENHRIIGGKKINVELQDNSRRRKGAGEGCYECGKPGHFARECRNKSNKNHRGRSPSDSRENRDKKKKKKRHHSFSSVESQSRSRKKQKKKRSKSRGKKQSKSKKSKKEKKRSYSYSD